MKQNKRGDVNAKKGFTIIEVLIAIAVLSVIMAALYSTFLISRRAIDAVDDSLIRLQEARAVVDALKRELDAAFYSQDKEYSLFRLSDRDYYGKQASQLFFTSFYNRSPGLSAIAYTAEEKNGKLILTKKVSSAFGKGPETKGFELIGDIESFNIEARYDDRWVKTWDNSLNNRIPDEIRVSITIRAKKRNGSGDSASPDSITISDSASPRVDRII